MIREVFTICRACHASYSDCIASQVSCVGLGRAEEKRTAIVAEIGDFPLIILETELGATPMLRENSRILTFKYSSCSATIFPGCGGLNIAVINGNPRNYISIAVNKLKGKAPVIGVSNRPDVAPISLELLETKRGKFISCTSFIRFNKNRRSDSFSA